MDAIRRDRPDAVIIEEERNRWMASSVNRVSLRAIIAGVAVAMVVQLVLNLLGIAIGAASIDPVAGQDLTDFNLGSATVIWMAASALISLFAGGLVAGRMAGIPDDTDGVLHGLAVWAFATLISILFLSSAVGSVVGTATNILQGGLNIASQGVADLAPEVANALEVQDIRLQQLQNEAQALIPDLAPATAEGQETLDVRARELNLAVERLLNPQNEAIAEQNRQELINVLTRETNLTEQEINQAVNEWETTLQQVGNNVNETITTVTDSIADTIAALAGAFFAIMIVGAFAAGAGGMIGTPEHAAPRVE